MKPTDHRDPLDQKIDALLASRPLKPSDDFAARILAEAETSIQSTARHPLGTRLKLALPIAAAVALTFSLLQLKPSAPEPAQTTVLSSADAQEIFLLEESLASLATLSNTEFGGEDLLSTLDALYQEI